MTQDWTVYEFFQSLTQDWTWLDSIFCKFKVIKTFKLYIYAFIFGLPPHLGGHNTYLGEISRLNNQYLKKLFQLGPPPLYTMREFKVNLVKFSKICSTTSSQVKSSLESVTEKIQSYRVQSWVTTQWLDCDPWLYVWFSHEVCEKVSFKTKKLFFLHKISPNFR